MGEGARLKVRVDHTLDAFIEQRGFPLIEGQGKGIREEGSLSPGIYGSPSCVPPFTELDLE